MAALISGISLIVISIVLLTGHGFTGYGTISMGMSEEEKEKYDTKALCKFIGKIILPIAVLTCLLGIDNILKWYVWIYIAVVVGLSIFAVVYIITGNRFKK
jgi:hypothetical protein